MATTARLDLSIWRNDEVYEFKLKVRGLDLTQVTLRAQVRLAPDTPGAALADLYTVTNGNAEGIRLAGVAVVDGVPESDVRIRINKSTRQAFPYAGEVGDAAKLAWAMSIGDQTRIVGNVFVLAHALASDSAPTDRPEGGAASSGSYPNASATLTVTQDNGATLSIDGIDEILPLLADAQAAVDAATAAIENPTPVSLADAQRNNVLLVDGGYYKGGAAPMTGALQASLPQGINDARFTVIEGYMMDVNGRYEFTISGSNGGAGWDYPIVTYTGKHALPFPRVRFGRDAALRYCFWMGETDSQWAFPNVWITRVLFGNNVIPPAWMGRWDIAMVTAFANLQTGPIEPIAAMSTVNPVFTGTMNGIQFRAPLFHGGTYLGFEAGVSIATNSTYNHIFGYQAGKSISTGFNNCLFGLQAGSEITVGSANSLFGTQAGQYITSGVQNSLFGIHAGLSITTGSSNVIAGAGAGEYGTVFESNTLIGTYTGRDLQGSRNDFFGQRTGMYETNTNDETWIGSIPDAAGNPDRDALIRGNKAAKTVKINAKFAANGKTPVAPTTLPAALPTDGTATNAAMATMLNAVRTSLIATGLSVAA